MFAGGFRMRFDAMCAVTGPYAREILENRLGAAPGTVVNGTPLPDFGGMHPDPNPIWAKALMDEMFGAGRARFRRGLGRGRRPQHGRRAGHLCLAVGQPGGAGGQCAPGAGLCGRAEGGGAVDADLVRRWTGWPRRWGSASYETPTGWKFFGNLLDAGRATLCGEESFGTGSDHVREKDGLWAVLLWLNILAVRKESVADILADALVELRAQLLLAATISRRSRSAKADAMIGALREVAAQSAGPAGRGADDHRRRRLCLYRSGGWLGQPEAGCAHPLRRWQPDRDAAVGHGHRGRDAAALSGAV